MSRLNRVAILVLLSMVSIACIVQSISGPSIGTPLQRLAYSLRIHGDPCHYVNSLFGTGVLLVDIPLDWQYERASFAGVLAGDPVSGEGIEPAPCPVTASAPPPVGFKRVCIAMPTPYGMYTSDSVDVAISFRAGATLGVFPLQFWAGAINSFTPDRCIQPSPTVFPVTIAPALQPPAIPTFSPWGLAALSLATLGAGLYRVRASTA